MKILMTLLLAALLTLCNVNGQLQPEEANEANEIEERRILYRRPGSNPGSKIKDAPNSFNRYATVPVPSLSLEKHRNIGTSKIWLGNDEWDTSYITLLRSGDDVGGVTFGGNLDENMEPIKRRPRNIVGFEEPFAGTIDGDLYSYWPDFTSLLDAGPNSPTPYAMFVHFEQPVPSISYRVNVDVTDDCRLEVHSIEALDWSEWRGLWIPCSGSISNWGTHLGSEEYEPDARLISGTYDEFLEEFDADPFGNGHAANILNFIRYFGYYEIPESMEILREIFNPYRYGHVTEMSIDGSGASQVKKWYTTGRQALELGFLFPDGKVMLISDDGTNTMMTALVLDTPNDLSSGTLYGAKFTQLNDEYGGEFDITWIKLGKATQDELVAMVDDLTFDKIFETATPKTPEEVTSPNEPTCPEGFTSVNSGPYAHTKNHQCLKLKEGMEKAAAFFETRRYAAMLGATTELSKFEGIAFVPQNKALYFGMADVRDGMEDFASKGEPSDKFDFGGPNDIRLPYNPCGCVYEAAVEEKDGWLQLISMKGFICGNTDFGTNANNTCNVNSIAQPDNVYYMGKDESSSINSLLIGEDTPNHQNNYMWVYNFDTGEMTRILSVVYGAEATSPAFYTDAVPGCQFLVANSQHPYSESDQARRYDLESEGLEGYVGYIGPIGTKK